MSHSGTRHTERRGWNRETPQRVSTTHTHSLTHSIEREEKKSHAFSIPLLLDLREH